MINKDATLCVDNNYRSRKRSVWFMYKHGFHILPMYSDKPELSKSGDVVITAGMHSGVLAYGVMLEMIELAKQTPRKSNLMRHKTSWWIENSKLKDNLLPIPRADVLDIMTDLDHYNGSEQTLVFWVEQYYHLVEVSGLSISHRDQLIKIHDKVVRYYCDNSEWDHGMFEFVLDE